MKKVADYQEAYVSNVRTLVYSLQDILTPDQIKEVSHLIDHNEAPEAMRTLAWIIVEENKAVSKDVILQIREFSEGFVEKKDMPPTLDSQIR